MEINIYDLIPRIHLEPITIPEPPLEFETVAGNWAQYEVKMEDEMQINEILKKNKQ